MHTSTVRSVSSVLRHHSSASVPACARRMMSLHTRASAMPYRMVQRSHAVPHPQLKAGVASTAPAMKQVLPTQPWSHHKAEEGAADIYTFLEPQTSSWQYLLVDPVTSEAAIIDPVLDYNPASGTISTDTADGILAFIREKGFKITRILETHAHADHLTASQYYKAMLPGDVPICIGERITQVQKHFGPKYGFEPQDLGNTFDVFLKDDEEFLLGKVTCRVIHLPGHTPDHVGYVVGKAVFTGDSIFMPDLGSARADFPGGNAKDLYASMKRLLSLPKDYMLFVGHDYPVERPHNCVATVGEQQELNKHGKLGTTEEKFVLFREARDSVLGAPRLLHPSLQVNIRAGKLPPSKPDGPMWLKTPIRIANPLFPIFRM